MTLDDFKEQRGAARAKWHEKRDKVAEAQRAFDDAVSLLFAARIVEDVAHERFKQAFAEWRIARDWKVYELRKIRMIQKLRD